MPTNHALLQRCDQASLVIAATLLLASLWLHLLPALFAGMVAFLLIHYLAGLLARHVSNAKGKLIAVSLITLLVLTLLGGSTLLVITLLKSDAGLSALFDKLASIINDAGKTLPAMVSSALPSGSAALQQWLVAWLRSHSAEMQSVGKEAGVALAHILVGLVIGSLLAFHDNNAAQPSGPLAQQLLQRIRGFCLAFRKIVVAQLQISLLNTLFTTLYLMVVLPLCGVQLPFGKTMILLTFLFGLLPVVGNLISNAIIITVSTTHSAQAALGSLAFLVLIHKAEYFLNARIVGSQIQAKAWELLLAMLLMEAMFGLPGVVAAPVYYAYLKAELRQRALI